MPPPSCPTPEYRADSGAFFKSMHGTLNHLLAADWVWMQRFTGQGPAPERLDMIHARAARRPAAAREAEDRRIIDYVDGLDEAQLAGASAIAASRRRRNSCRR